MLTLQLTEQPIGHGCRWAVWAWCWGVGGASSSPASSPSLQFLCGQKNKPIVGGNNRSVQSEGSIYFLSTQLSLEGAWGGGVLEGARGGFWEVLGGVLPAWPGITRLLQFNQNNPEDY